MAVILVVEDNAGLRSVVCRHLARRGHTPVPASTGAEALRRATRRSPSIALLDLRLPDTDGLRLFTELRRDRPGIVGVIMTAYASVPSAVECLHLLSYAQQIRLDLPNFRTCLNGMTTAKVRADAAAASALGITGTPAFFVGAIQPDGRVKVTERIAGARPLATFEAAIDKALATSVSGTK